MVALLISACAWPAFCATEAATGKARLRELAPGPSINLQLGFNWDNQNGFTTMGEQKESSEEIADLLGSMDSGLGDAKRYRRLYEIYHNGDFGEDKAVAALSNAISGYRLQVEKNPADARLLSDLGDALGESVTNRAEAEACLRKAIELSSNDWYTWNALGRYLQSRASDLLGTTDPALLPESINFDSSQIHESPGSHIQEAEDYLSEAAHCFDREVELSPTNPVVYANRGYAAMARSMLEVVAKSARHEDLSHLERVLPNYSGGGEADFKRMVELDPRNYRVIAFIVAWEALTSVENAAAAQGKSHAHIHSAEEFWSATSESASNIIHQELIALEQLGAGTDKHFAAAALEAKGFLYSNYIHDDSAALDCFHRAFALDPANEKCGVAIVIHAVSTTNYDEALTVSKEMVRHKKTLNPELCLALSYFKIHQPAAAVEPLKHAALIAPENPAPPLALASAHVGIGDESSLAKVPGYLREARAMLDKLPPPPGIDYRELDYLFIAGLYQGLIGNTERARNAFNAVLERAPNYHDASLALKALDN